MIIQLFPLNIQFFALSKLNWIWEVWRRRALFSVDLGILDTTEAAAFFA